MAYDRFLIAPYKSGLDKSLATWLTPEESFQRFKNVNIFKGIIKKRFGAQLIGDSINSRVRVSLSRFLVPGGDGVGKTDGAGYAVGTLPAGYIYALDQKFSIGAETFTIVTLGVVVALAHTGIGTGTIDTTTGDFEFTGAPVATQIYWHCEGNAGDVKTDSITGNAIGFAPGWIYKEGQMFSVGSQLFSVYQSGAMLSTGAATGTFITATGEFTITGADVDAQIYFYPTEPIMEITHYEKGPINEHATYVMDTQFVYKYSGTDWIKDTAFTGIMHGDNKQFFWSTNYLGTTSDAIALFTSNFNATVGTSADIDDQMYCYDGTDWLDFSKYTKFNSSSDIVSSAKIIVAWKNRLLLLNTIEKTLVGSNNKAHPNRVRYSHNGNPFSANAWLQRRQIIGADKADGGGYLDAPVEEQIMSAAVIKDRLIIYFERSTWELAYTGNTGLPFVWKSISPDIGCESTYSTITLENEVVTVDITGVYACNGTSLGRIDNQIPEEIFSFLKSSDGTKRVHGIKDYFNGLIYWTFLDNASSNDQTYPDKLLVYNYRNQSWSIYDDTITTFGYFEQSSDRTWAAIGTWDVHRSWGSYYAQGQSRRIIAGNHQGFLFLVNNDEPQNAPVLPISNLTIAVGIATLTIPDHNLVDDEFVKLIDNNITAANTIFKVLRYDSDTVLLVDRTFAGTYKGGGTLTRVSKIDIQSKDWNPYVKTGDRLSLAKIDFCVANTHDGEVSVNYNVDSVSGIDFAKEGLNSGVAMGTNVLETHGNLAINPLDKYKKVLWNTVYFQAMGDFVNINITLTDTQMVNQKISLSPFELQGMILYTSKEGR